MKVILRQNFEALGQIGDIVEVKDGYALNYLLPRKIAYAALKGNLRALEEEKKTVAKKTEQELRDSETLAAELEKTSITIPVQVGEEDKIFGSVTSQNISDLLKEQDFDIDRRKIQLDEPLRALGVYDVPIRLHADVEAKIKVWVVKE